LNCALVPVDRFPKDRNCPTSKENGSSRRSSVFPLNNRERLQFYFARSSLLLGTFFGYQFRERTGQPRKECSMMARKMPSPEMWLTKNRPQMIDCPFQPGRLRLSREACKKRTLAGQMISPEHDGLFLSGWNGLLLCRKCPIGNELLFGPETRWKPPRRAAPRKGEPQVRENSRW
jgi:hypothetical protein